MGLFTPSTAEQLRLLTLTIERYQSLEEKLRKRIKELYDFEEKSNNLSLRCTILESELNKTRNELDQVYKEYDKLKLENERASTLAEHNEKVIDRQKQLIETLLLTVEQNKCYNITSSDKNAFASKEQ